MVEVECDDESLGWRMCFRSLLISYGGGGLSEEDELEGSGEGEQGERNREGELRIFIGLGQADDGDCGGARRTRRVEEVVEVASGTV